MDWKRILKEQQTLDFEFEGKPKSPISDDAQTTLDDPRWRRTISKPQRDISKPKSEVRDSGGADASDVLPPLRELRTEWLKDPRGVYGDTADKVTKLASIARKDPRKQKKALGYIRKLIRQANIPEADYR